MTTDVMMLSEFAEELADLAESFDEEPAVLVGDIDGGFNVSAKDGYSTLAGVGYATECFDGNGVFELGDKTDLRFFGTAMILPEHLGEEAQQHLDDGDGADDEEVSE